MSSRGEQIRRRGTSKSWCGTSKSWRGKRARTTQCNTEHDIYGVYCEEDENDVRPILDVLRENRLDVYDPYLDGLANETLFKSWLERGIYRSNVTLIFLTKQFITHNYCKYQADSAVMRYTQTRGQHRIVVVMLQSCKVPKNLQHFNCVYAWKFRVEPQEQYKRILKAIYSPRDKFRRGNIICRNMNTNSANMSTTKFRELTSYKKNKAPEQSLLKYKHLLLNLNKLKYSLENCEIECTSENCTFRCSGLRITDQFFEHVKCCRYQHVHCRYCRQLVLRKNLGKHEETNCKHRRVPCQNEACGQKLTAKEMFRHAVICSYKEEVCPNIRYGCTGVFARKDKSKHFEICEYERICCRKCNVLMFRVAIDDHICERAQLDEHVRETDSHKRSAAVYKCRSAGCSFTGYKGDVETHQVRCDMRIEQCSDCGMRLPVREHLWHKKQCDKMVECGLCHQYVASSSKLTHDRWICTGQNIRTLCEICHTCVSHTDKEIHSAGCVFQPHPSPTIVGNMPLPDTVPGPGERHSAPSGGARTLSAGLPKPSTPITRPQDATKSYNYKSPDIVDVIVPSPMSLSSSASSSESHVNRHPSNQWTPAKRYRWHYLMYEIDRNNSDYKAILAVSRNNIPYKGVQRGDKEL